MKSFKKILSLFIAVLMVISTFTAMAVSTGAVTYENTKLYFDVSTTGWSLGSKDKVGFYIYSDKYGAPISWGGKKLNGTDEGDGIWSFEPAAKGIELIEGEQYKIIFTAAGNQTLDLFFDTNCLGHVGYCTGDMLESPVDSSKKSQAAYWKDLDPAKYGPAKQITSLGNLIGTCLPQGMTDKSLFTKWLTDSGSQGLKNAVKYMVEPGSKTCQQLIDDLAGDLGLTKDFVDSAITANKDAIDEILAAAELSELFAWSKEDSVLPDGGSQRAVDSMPAADEVTAGMDTFTVYFQMPNGQNCFPDENGKLPDSWSNELNEIDGVSYAGIYWWQGSKKLDLWPGAKMTLVDAEQNIFSVNVPDEPEVLTNIIFNNSVDGGTDETAEVFGKAHQSVDLNIQGAEPDEYETLPEGTPDADTFDGCIYVIDEDAIAHFSSLESRRTEGGRWYIYYGSGCYGMYAETSPSFTSVEENCCNPGHHHGSGFTVSGSIRSYLRPGTVTATIKGEDNNYTATVSGITEYIFENVPDGKYVLTLSKADHVDRDYKITVAGEDVVQLAELCPLGDVNNDGKTTQFDYSFALAYSRKAKTLDEYQIKCGDVFGKKPDGKLTTSDASRILQHVRKLNPLYTV